MNEQQFNELIAKSKFFNKSIIQEARLNIGCGPNVFGKGWINYDREDLSNYLNYIHTAPLTGMPPEQQKLSQYLKDNGMIDFRVHDFMNGFPQHADNSIDGIYLGQVVEHINRIHQIPKLLKELYRILKPGGVLRITTPDLDLLIKAYLNNEMNKFENEQPEFYKTADSASQLAFIMFGASGESCKQTAYDGHFFLYTKTSMSKILLEAGFKNIEFYYETSKSKDQVIAKEAVDCGMSHSFITEVIK